MDMLFTKEMHGGTFYVVSNPQVGPLQDAYLMMFEKDGQKFRIGTHPGLSGAKKWAEARESDANKFESEMKYWTPGE